MKIVICIKPVRGSLVYDKNDAKSQQYMINPYDMFLLMQLKKLKQTCTLHTVVLCMGPDSVNDLLTKCLSMDMDEAFLLSDAEFAGSDTYVTSYVLAEAIKKIGEVDFVLCGEKAIDGETGQVPYELSQRLNLCVYNGMTELTDIAHSAIVVKRKTEDFILDSVIYAPAVIVGEEFTINEYETNFIQLKRARSKPRTVWNHQDMNLIEGLCGMQGSKTKVIECKRAVHKREHDVIEGQSGMLAKKVLELIKGEGREIRG